MTLEYQLEVIAAQNITKKYIQLIKYSSSTVTLLDRLKSLNSSDLEKSPQSSLGNEVK